MIKFNNDWDNLLKSEFEKEYYLNLREFLKKEYSKKIIYPKADEIFNAFIHTSYNDIKLVILGQDPYHSPNTAHGLAFSVKEGQNAPPSLVNIHKELFSDLGIDNQKIGCLLPWAKQGVFLLNTTLTVECGKANSHSNAGWNIFTDNVISLINQKEEPVVFLLMGKFAQSKINLINVKKHHIICTAHPSPLSAHNGFFGSRCFSQTLDFLGKDRYIDFKL